MANIKENENMDVFDIQPKEEKKETNKKENTKSNAGPIRRYQGPLNLFIDEEVAGNLTSDILDFKNFFDGLGEKGITYEDFFDKIIYYEHPDEKVNRTIVTNKFYQLRTKGFLTYKWIEIITDILGYQSNIVFTPKPDPKLLDEKKENNDGYKYLYDEESLDLSERPIVK